MKNKFSAFAAVFFLLFAFAACKKPVPQLALYVPKDASVLFTIDTKAIMDKIASSGITIDSLANLFTKKKDDYALRWNDIKNSGIDLSNPIYIFSKQTNSMQTGNVSSSGVIAEVQDAAKLEAFFKKERVGANALSGGKYKYIALGDDFVAGWTDKILIVSAVKGGTSSPGTYSTGEGTLSQLQLTTLFNQNEASSIATAQGFNDMLSQKGDVHFYTNTSAGLSALPMIGMSKLSSLIEGSYTDGAINFDNGKITASSETHYNKTFSDMLNKYPSKQIDKGMITKFPGNISGFGILAFNPKLLVDILHYLGFDMMANGYVSQIGFSIDDVMNAFSGDIAFVASDVFIKHNNLPGMSNNTPEKSKYLLIMRIGDKAAFDKVMTALVNKNILSKNGDQYQLGIEGGHDFAIESTGAELLIGSGDELIKTYETGNGKSSLPGDIDKEISSKSMALYFDVNGLLKNVNINDTSGSKTLALAQSTFKNFIASSGKGDGKSISGSFTLNFVNNNENSLASLTKFMTVAHEEDMKREQNVSAFPPVSHDDDSNDEDSANDAQ